MKTFQFVMYLFYKYYSKGGTKQIPYFSALCAVVMLIYIHIFQVLIVLDKVDLLPMKKGDTRIDKYWKLALFLLPIFFIISFLVKPSDLKNLTYNEEKVKRGGVYLVMYIIFNTVLLFALMFAFSKS